MEILRKKTVLFILALVLLSSGKLGAAEVVSREYKIKAAFLYNFMKVIHWPADVIETKKKNKKPYIVAIVGRDLFGKDILPITRKTINGLRITVVRMPGPSQIKDIPYDEKKKQYPYLQKLNGCDVVFISKSESAYVKKILGGITSKAVLTIGESPGFLEAGGVINFIPGSDKGHFEINIDAARKANLRISSKLLRLAKRIIDSKSRKPGSS